MKRMKIPEPLPRPQAKWRAVELEPARAEATLGAFTLSAVYVGGLWYPMACRTRGGTGHQPPHGLQRLGEAQWAAEYRAQNRRWP